MKAASRVDPLLADWFPQLQDAATEWSTISRLAGDRAQDLVDDYPVAAGMLSSRIMATLGPEGLGFRSLYAVDNEPDTSETEAAARREIDACIKDAAPYLDVEGCLSRREVEAAIRTAAILRGDGFAVRVGATDPDSPIRHAWRIVHPTRVQNPIKSASHVAVMGGVVELDNGGRIQDGIEVDANGRRAALHVAVERRAAGGRLLLPSETQRIPWRAPDGAVNVLHAIGLRRQGSLRGITEFAPIILGSRLLQSLGVSYVATKRVHASHPMLIEVDDIEAARRAYAGTAFANLLVGRDNKVTMNQTAFMGADFREFYDVELRNLCTAWSIPYELVVGDHSAKSGASSRSLWQQFYQTAAVWQTQHIETVTHPIDTEIVRDCRAMGVLSLSGTLAQAMRGRYKRPPRIMPDPLKEAQAAEAWTGLGVSPTTIFADAGMDYADEVMQAAQDRRLRQAQEMDEDEDEPPAEPEQEQDDEPEDDEQGDGQEDAQAAAVQASGGDDMTRAEFIAAMQAMSAGRSGVTVEQRVSMDADTAAILGRAIAEHQPAAQVHVPAPVVNVAAPAVTVEAARVDVPAPVVQVDVAAPVVNVAAPEVTVDNQVIVPQRPVMAKQQSDGSVLMTPVEG